MVLRHQLAGLDEEASCLLQARYASFCALLFTWFISHPDWDARLLTAANHSELTAMLQRLESQVLMRKPGKTDRDRRSGRQIWEEDYLRPLAEGLELVRVAERSVILHLRGHGYFDIFRRSPRRVDQRCPDAIIPVRPNHRDLIPRVSRIIDSTKPEELAKALVSEGLCRNTGNAQAVVAILKRSRAKKPNAAILRCHARGLFDVLPDLQWVRPAVADVAPIIQAILTTTEDQFERAALLIQQRVCRTHAHAERVLKLLAETPNAVRKHNSLGTRLRRCWGEGLFDRSPAQSVKEETGNTSTSNDGLALSKLLRIHSKAQKSTAVDRTSLLTNPLVRPEIDVLVRHLEALRGIFGETVTFIEQLVATRACLDVEAATYVAKSLDLNEPHSLINSAAIALTRHVLLEYADIGPLALLDEAHYPPSVALKKLERLIQEASSLEGSHADGGIPLLPEVIAQLRYDVVSLFNTVNVVVPGLWNSDLLASPPYSENRGRSLRHVSVEHSLRLRALLQQGRGYSSEDAQHLSELLLHRGLTAIIDWRRGVPLEQAGQVWTDRSLRRVLYQHLAALNDAAHTEIWNMIGALQAACVDANVTLSLRRVFNDQPGSAYRRRLKRRLPVSYGVVLHYRREYGVQQTKGLTRFKRSRRRTPSPVLVTANRLIAAFAERTGLSQREAASRLWTVWGYGALGFLPKKDWPKLIDVRLVSLLRLYKLGRIEGRLIIADALRQINRYAAMLNVPPISMQLARALLSTQVKPLRWNSGEGESVAAVRKRVGLVLPGVPWLHRVWRIFHVEIQLPIEASRYSGSSEKCHMLLVVDLGCQRPVACWITLHKPGLPEVKLALYQAIWHPGALDWPLRGLPEVIQVSDDLVGGGQEELAEAANWLLAQVHIIPNATQQKVLRKLPETQAIIDDLVLVGLDDIRRQAGKRTFTVKEAHDYITGWFRTSEKCFPGHRPGNDDPARKAGYAAPSYDSPCVGLLLPVGGEARSVRNAILIEGRTFTAPGFSVEPGLNLRYRIYPYRYDGTKPDERMEEAVFIEDVNGHLHYLTHQQLGHVEG